MSSPSTLPEGMMLSKDNVPFLSKDRPLPRFESQTEKISDLSSMYQNPDWIMNYVLDEPRIEEARILSKPKSFDVADDFHSDSAFTSPDWNPFHNLDDYEVIPYLEVLEDDSDLEDSVETLQPQVPDFQQTNFSLSPIPLIPQEEVKHSLPQIPSPPLLDFQAIVVGEEVQNDPQQELFSSTVSASSAGTAPKKKRKRNPRKKIVPEVKEYVNPTDVDVLLGRGGRSNHHPGNKRYREEVRNLQRWYLGEENKNKKTDLSQLLVDYVHAYQGRFLQKDDIGWYLIPNIVARRKASQALREDNDAEKRAAKRDRFLKKKAAMELLGQS